MPDDLQQTLDAIDQMRGWGGKDDDDPYPNPNALNNAKQWAYAVYHELLGEELIWQQPNVTLDMEGDVCFEWWSGKRKTTVYVETFEIEWLTYDGETDDEQQDRGFRGSVRAVRWILSDGR